MSALEHGTALVLGEQGVLIRGPSGSGKSSLALDLIQKGATLVADDQVFLSACHDRLIAAAPHPLAGKIEVHGYGIVTLPFERQACIRLIADLVEPDQVERMPEEADRSTTVLKVVLPRLVLPARSDRSSNVLTRTMQDIAPMTGLGLR